MPCEQHPVRPLNPEEQDSGALGAFALLNKPWGTYHVTLPVFRALLNLWKQGSITSGWLVRHLPDEWGLDATAMIFNGAQCADVHWLPDQTAAEVTRLRLEDEADENRSGLVTVMAPGQRTRSTDRDRGALLALWRDFFASVERAEQQGEDGDGGDEEGEGDDGPMLEALSAELRAWLNAGYPPCFIGPPELAKLGSLEYLILTEMMLKMSAPPGVHPDECED